ncbi:MAG: hypothetical protein QFF03_15895 [Pseudomonadota bacterium]|nr:hypothetical protein [Pseudomonadota bacterium]
MPKVALVTVHGMGVTLSNYADPMKAKLQQALGARYDELMIRPAYYQGLLQENEATVWNRVDAHSKVHYDDLRKFVLFGFGDAAGLETRKDEPDSVYELAQQEIARALLDVYTRCGSDCHVVFLTQSLGAQVLSNYIYDGQKNKRGGAVDAGIWRDLEHTRAVLGGLGEPAMLPFLRAETCMAWVSTGCNIPIFVAAHKTMNIKPIQRPNGASTFRWLNIYDPDDVLGWPLQPLSPEYDQLVEDRAINAGQGALDWIMRSWNPLSHTTYWTDDGVIKPLADMLRKLLG